MSKCYWGKQECVWEHCKEITGHNIAKNNEESKKIVENKRCGGYAFEKFFTSFVKNLTPEDTNSFASYLLAFITKGSKILNEMQD